MDLEVTIKIADKKGIIIGRSIILNNKPMYVAGLYDESVVLSNHEPKTLFDCQVHIYTIKELRQFAKEGKLKGMVKL